MQAISSLPLKAPIGQSPPYSTDADNKTVNRIFCLVVGAVGLIALGSFSLSFMALHELATNNGVPQSLGWIWPLIVDVSMVIYTAGILVAQLQRRGAKLPIGLTIFFAVVTVTGNLLHAPPTPLGWFVAALPPLSLILGTEMLRTMAHHNILRRAALQTLNELNTRISNKHRELDKLGVQIEQAQSQLEQLQVAQNVSDTAKTGSIERARQAKSEQDAADKESRLVALVDILRSNPEEGVKNIATRLNVSRTTIYSDLSTLEEQQVISKDENGWRVNK